MFGSDAKYAVHFTASEESTPKWAAQKLYNNGVSYDILTTSCYIFYDHGTLANLTTMLSEIKSNYKVDVMVGKTSWAYTTSSVSSTQGTAWENQAMFDMSSGKALESLKVFAMVKKTLWNNSH